MESFKSLKDHVYDYIADAIANGKLSPNQKISEAQICKTMEVSRTPVREALIQLSAEGVLENTPRRGFTLKTLLYQDLEELYEIIGSLDGMTARDATSQLDQEDFKTMDFYIQVMDLSINSGNFPMYMKHQRMFHEVYMQKCPNRTMVEILKNLTNRLIHKTYEDDKDGITRKVLLRTNQEHKEILKLLKEGKAEEVKDYLSNVHWHISNAYYELPDISDELDKISPEVIEENPDLAEVADQALKSKDD